MALRQALGNNLFATTNFSYPAPVQAPIVKETGTPGGQPSESAGAEGVAEVERALIRLMRQANRPTWWSRLASAGGLCLDRVEYATLARVEEASGRGAARLTDVADAMGVDISTASRQIRALELAGLVERSCDPSDQRATRLGLSPAGQETLERTRRLSQETLCRLLSSWSSRERAVFAQLLNRLVDDLTTSLATEGGRP